MASLVQLQATDFSACQDLADILTTTPSTTNQLGNFTEQPTDQLLQECSSTSSLFLFDADALADVFKLPTPLVKVFFPLLLVANIIVRLKWYLDLFSGLQEALFGCDENEN